VQHQAVGRFLFVVFIAGVIPAMAGAQGNGPGAYDLVLGRAIGHLPKRPIQVTVIDADEARPDVRDTLLKLDAFTVAGSQVVYLVKQSAVLQGAIKGSRLYEHMLASIIWHEMAHADGAGERAAQRAEEELWTRFVRDGIFDQVTALRYLRALTNRHDGVPADASGCTLRGWAPSSDSRTRILAGTVVNGDIDARTLQAAIEALPRRPERIVVVETRALPPQESRLRGLDGFVLSDRRVIYLRRESPTLLAAETSGGPYVLMLALVIWHEMAHLEGIDERQAQRREEDLWTEFMQRGLVDPGLGLTYLAELRRRR
jgi:hypothetical protein